MSTLKFARREGNQCRSLQGGEMLDRARQGHEPGDRKVYSLDIFSPPA